MKESISKYILAESADDVGGGAAFSRAADDDVETLVLFRDTAAHGPELCS